jgi:hypothetical protein
MSRKKQGKPGRPAIHAGYAYLVKANEAIPKNRGQVRRYLEQIREGLVQDYGPEEKDLSTSQLILINLIVEKVGFIRLITEYAREKGLFEKGKLRSCLKENLLSYENSCRLAIMALNKLEGKAGAGEDIDGYIRRVYEEPVKKGKKT